MINRKKRKRETERERQTERERDSNIFVCREESMRRDMEDVEQDLHKMTAKQAATESSLIQSQVLN